ncbi:MAG: recombinase family protein [Chloroflexota bacterium]|nr:recombinase family protein [Chloroflexota bacterium]
MAALWLRVSGHSQEEQSPDSQLSELKSWVEALGYVVTPNRILRVVWGSQELLDCPETSELLAWAKNGEIHAWFATNEDRMAGNPPDVWVIYGECQRHGVHFDYKQTPRQEGIAGDVLSTLNAAMKRWQVYRARQGAHDGLRDRARLRGLPPTMGKPFGMRWEDARLVPDEQYSVASDIWKMALEGWKLRTIAKELTRRGIPTPREKRVWTASTVRCILANRSYAGVIEALKAEAVEPARRLKRTYGKSSTRQRPASERVRLPGLVTHAIVTEDEFEWVQRRLRDNQRLAPKNTKLREYLLKGLIRCSICGRLYIGVTRKNWSYYYCRGRWGMPWGAERCLAEKFRAAAIEQAVWGMVVDFLRGPEGFLAEMQHRQTIKGQSLESIRRELVNLDRQDQGEQEAEARAFRYLTRRKVSEDVYEREVGLIRTRRRWITEQRERLEGQLADLERYSLNVETIEALRQRVESRLTGATQQDRRFVLEAVSAKVIAHGDGMWELELEVPRSAEPAAAVQTVNSRPGCEGTGTGPGR